MVPPAPDQATVSMRQKLMALIALSSTGTLVGLFSKVSQVSGRYEFSPCSAVVCTEFFKLVISLTIICKLLFRRELVDRTKRPGGYMALPASSPAASVTGPNNNRNTASTSGRRAINQQQNGNEGATTANPDASESGMVVVVSNDNSTTNNDVMMTTQQSQQRVTHSGDDNDADDQDADDVAWNNHNPHQKNNNNNTNNAFDESNNDSSATAVERTYTLLDDWREFWATNATLPVILHEAGLAGAYSIVNVVTYAIFIHASGSMFFLLKASSPVVTAVLLWLMVNRRISRPQWIAVIMQCFGLFGTQLNPCGSTAAVSFTGYLLILVNVVVSCAAGVWNEHIIKNYGTSVNAQNAILYTFGVIINLFLFWFAPPEWTGSTSDKKLSFFQGYNYAVLAVIMANGSVGLVITMVYKYADVVVKTFGLAGSTMTLYMLEMAGFIPGGRSMPLSTTLTGAAAVFYASYIYIVPGGEFAPGNGGSGGGSSANTNNNNLRETSVADNICSNINSLSEKSSTSNNILHQPFDIMTLSWSGALAHRKIKLLLGIGVMVVICFMAAKLACTLGM